ncbi:MAG: ATP-grasp domain-containing protein [Lentisphaeria bacterium]
MKKILVIHDKLKQHPTADELDTVLEVEQVRAALEEGGYQTQTLEFSLNFAEMAQKTQGADCLFNLTETLGGSSLLYLPPLYFEQFNQKFTGVDSTGMYLTSDKLLTKKILQMNNISCPASMTLDDLSHAKNFLNRALILKPVNQEASVGINDQSVRAFHSEAELQDVLSSCSEPSFVEDFIDGREFNISVIQKDGKPLVLPPAEIKFVDFPEGKPKIVGYEAKWSESSFEYTHTRRCFDFDECDSPLLQSLQELCQKIYILFCKKGYIRVDLRIDKMGKPFVMEINANPCIAKDSGFTAANLKAGFDYKAMIWKIVEQA